MRSLILFFLLLGLISPAVAADLRVGASAVVITPPEGTPMAGYYSTRLSEGVHDDLYAKAVVIEQGGTKAALVSCDLISMPRGVVEAVRAGVEALNINLSGDAVMVSATHSHTGPVVLSGWSGEKSLGGGTPAAKAYRDSLPGLIVKSIEQANSRLTPARTLVARGEEHHLSFNRRFHMKDGSVGWNPGKLNPNIVKPAGPIDPDVPVVFFESADGKPIATYINFAMHLDTVGGLKVSADYPHTLSDLLARIHGPEMVTVFTIGTAGDINHINVSTDRPQKGPAEARRIGTVLAGEVIKTQASLQPVENSPLRSRSEIIKLPLPQISDEQLAQARKVAVTFGKDEPSFMQKVEAFKVLDVFAREGKPLEAEVQVIALGDELAWVSLPGEIFVEIGLAIKEQSPFRHTIIAELANGSVGYIPTQRAYAHGAYEVVSARCAEGSGEMLVEAAVRMLKELHGQAGDQ